MPWLVRQLGKSGEPLAAAWRQAAGMVLTGCPAALTAPLERIHAPGWLGRCSTVNPKVAGLMRVGKLLQEPIVVVVWSAGNRCGRSPSGMATWTAATMARVTAV